MNQTNQIIEFSSRQPANMDIESSHIQGSQGNTIVAAARQQKPDPHGSAYDDRLVEDNALAIVFGNTYEDSDTPEDSVFPGLLERGFTQVRNSGDFRGDDVGNTASVAALTTKGVHLRSAGDSIVLAIGKRRRVHILNILHAGGDQIITNWIAPGEIPNQPDNVDFLSWKDIEKKVGKDPTILIITDGVSASHDPDKITADIKTLLKEVKATPNDPEFPAQLINASKTTQNYRGYKLDDTSAVAGQKPKNINEQSVIGVFDGIGSGGAESAIAAKETAEAIRDQFVSGMEHESIPIVAAFIRKEMKSALAQIHKVEESGDHTAAQEILGNGFTNIFKAELSPRAKSAIIANSIYTYVKVIPEENQIAFLQRLNDIAGGGSLPIALPEAEHINVVRSNVHTTAQTLLIYGQMKTLLNLEGNDSTRIVINILARKMAASAGITREDITTPIAIVLSASGASDDKKQEIIHDALNKASGKDTGDTPLIAQTAMIYSIVKRAGGNITPITGKPDAEKVRQYSDEAVKILIATVAKKANINFGESSAAPSLLEDVEVTAEHKNKLGM